jgi:hypothetical protein
MKSNRTALAIGLVLALASCNFGFLDDADLTGTGEVLTVVETAFDGGKRYSYYNSDTVLQYYEDHFITDSRTMQMQRYSAEDLLRYGYLYQYDGDNRTLVAYYDSASTIKWYQVFTYPGTLVQTSAEFNAANILQWSRRYEYGTGDPQTGTIMASASYDGTGTLTGCAIYEYLDGTISLSFLTEYGTVSCAVAGSMSVAGSVSGSAPVSRATSKALEPVKVNFLAPTIPEYTVPSIPDNAARSALGVSGYTYWHYDPANNGTSELRLNEDWYPIRVSHSDDRLRLEKSVSVELEWNDANQITRKKSYYGTTLALDVSMTYNADGYPLKASTSGAAMLLPLDFELIYAERVPARLNVSSNGSLLQWFKYEYAGAVLPASFSSIRSIDPFALLDDLVKSSLVIKHYDGDDNRIETFEFIADDNDFRVNVRDSNNALNGYYLASYDADDLVASLSAYDGAGSPQWEYSYGYADAVTDEALLAKAGLSEAGLSTADFGRLAETYLTDDLTEYAKGFVMDLLF